MAVMIASRRLPPILRSKFHPSSFHGVRPVSGLQRRLSINTRTLSNSSASCHRNRHLTTDVQGKHQTPWQLHRPLLQQNRGFLSAISATGFNDYELGRKNFKLDVPEYYNFASDVIDVWADKEKNGELKRNLPAYWWIDDHGNELKWSFQDLSVKSKKVANLLTKDCGIQRLERLIVILPRVPEWWLINIACMRAGIVLSPGTTLLRSKDIRTRLQNSHATCIITDPDCAPHVDEVVDECPEVRQKLLVSTDGKSRPGWKDFNSLYNEASEDHECVKTKADEPMTIFFTSGTTGLPKMAEHSHASYGLGHILTGKYFLDLTPTDMIWNLSDTGWAKCAYSNLFGPWLQGACVFIHHTPKFDHIKILELLGEYPITVFCAPPTVYRMFIQEDLAKFNLTSIRHTISAGEPLNPEVIEEWRKETGQMIKEGYGQTETTLVCGTFRCIQTRPGSFGKAGPGIDAAIVDEDGNVVEDGVEGNIAIKVKPDRPVGLFRGYVDDPDRTAASFRGDYYLLGDRGYRDSDGYFWFVGRADDVIISAGYRIGPFEVESALIEHDAVLESAVVSSPDPVRGEVVKAFVILTEDYATADKETLAKELQEHVKKTTAPYKYPRKLEFVDSLPKTVSGKIRRVELRNKEWGVANDDAEE
ncbi:acyl-coenzyme A synthetase ACSM3, mitochondrial-like [Ptychodera flava]|uniref:acyl-coenzyme A synthetase ACSM3, mitochondrial-like n=1 Tax=Ptychodera flava TaxID=63121 RepID=UPI00396A2B7A